MRNWVCPECGEKQKALAIEVFHRCPKKQRLRVRFVLVKEGVCPTRSSRARIALQVEGPPEKGAE